MATANVEAARLILDHRWAALAATGPDGPVASMVAYAPEVGLEGLLMYLSGLSAHTGLLRESPEAALVIFAPDPGQGDPQILPRVSLRGTVRVVDRSSADFGPAWERYARRFPWAAPRLSLGDFVLFRFEIVTARYVGGFARASTLTGDEVRRGAGEVAASALGTRQREPR
jgi:putative heme iron utilization protein